MSEMPWVRFFPSDWLAGTRGMSAVETGIYITLIATMYEKGEPVAEDHARLARLCGASNSAFRKALETLIDDGKIQRVDGGLWNDRVGKESEIRSEKSGVGLRAANARWCKKPSKNKGGNDADALRDQSECNANQKPEAREDASLAQHPLDADGRVDFNLLEQRLREAAGLDRDPSPGLMVLAPVLGLLEAGHDLELDVLPTIRAVMARSKRRPRSWDYFTEAITEASSQRRGLVAQGLRPAATAQAEKSSIFDRLAKDARNGQAGNSSSDGPTIDVVPSIPKLIGQGERGDGESIHPRD